MAKARRLYLYTVSWIGLVILVVAATLALRLILNHAGVGPATSGSLNTGEKETIAQIVTFLVVGLGLWLFHWSTLERMTSGPTEEAAEERASKWRAFYFFLTLGIALPIAVVLWAGLVTDVVANRLNASPSGAGLDDWRLTGALVATAVWIYHAWIRDRDVRLGTLISGAAAWTSRLYLYGAAAFAVLGMVLTSISLVTTVLNEWAGYGYALSLNFGLGGSTDFGQLGNLSSAAPVWLRPILASVVGFLFAAGVWLLHWRYSNRICASSSTLAEPERRSRTRLGYFMVVVWLASAYAAAVLAGGLATPLVQALGVPNPTPAWYQVASPLLTAAPILVAWWWHRRRALVEGPYGPVGVSVPRVVGYVTAWVGVNATGIGLVYIFQVAFDRLFTSSPSSTFGQYADYLWKSELAAGLAYLVVGLVVWLIPWRAAQRRRTADWPGETRSTSRSFFLYLIEANWILVLAVGVGATLYPYVKLALGFSEPYLASEVEQPVAYGLAAAIFFAYYFLVIRSDHAGPPPATVAAWPSAGSPAGSAEPLPVPPAPESTTALERPAEPTAPTDPTAPTVPSGPTGPAEPKELDAGQ